MLFHVIEIENVITEESAANGDYDSTEITAEYDADFDSALSALDSNCWDNLDDRGNELICYPADYSQDYRTGDYTGHEVVIKAKNSLVMSLLMWRYLRAINN